MKKIILLLIGIVLIAAMLAPSVLAESKVKVTVWDGFRWPNEEGDKYHWIKSRIAKFEELYPAVDIELVEVAWENLGEKMNIAIAGHDWPDIGPVDISDGAVNLKYVEQGVIEPLDSFFTEEELNDFFPAALNAYSYNGHLYGIPTSMTVHALMLNLDIFKERGVEPPVDGKWTWNEFVTKMKKLTFDRDGDGNIDVYGFSTYVLKGYYEAWPFLMMDGGKPLSTDNTKYTFDSPEAISGLTKFASLKFNHKVSPMEMGGSDIGGCFQAFANPEKRIIAVEPWASWAIATLRNSKKYQMNFVVAEYPTGKTGESVTIGGSGGFVVFKQKDEEKLKIVAELAKFLSDAEQQYTFAVNYGTFPALKSAQAMDPFMDNPQMRQAAEMLKYAVSLPRHQSWPQIDERIQAQLQLVLNGEKTATEALKAAGEQVQRFLK
ncbi:MAG: sugar ABC transporter substrate-binding protein [Candidatus Omnitrophica bacterium]|nr:sugar ABC transporter substrate-binding protein [bacterium]MBU4346403.1 sugar ABC transporter substrate-binding protein [Candidatus Omnitrophota bacterium]